MGVDLFACPECGLVYTRNRDGELTDRCACGHDGEFLTVMDAGPIDAQIEVVGDDPENR